MSLFSSKTISIKESSPNCPYPRERQTTFFLQIVFYKYHNTLCCKRIGHRETIFSIFLHVYHVAYQDKQQWIVVQAASCDYEKKIFFLFLHLNIELYLKWELEVEITSVSETISMRKEFFQFTNSPFSFLMIVETLNSSY